MKHRIDPKIDCVFKALLGSDENRNLLIHFLNAMLREDLGAPITAVEILNPYNEREFMDDKLSVVDVKAKDAQGRLYQVEVQIVQFPNLPARIVYNWCDIYSQQLQAGQDYLKLQPTYSIWLLADNLLDEKKNPQYAHRIKLRDEKGQVVLHDCGGIYLFELKKFAATQVESEEQRWLKFFKEGDRLDDADLPEWMTTEEMRQAMSTLSGFSEKQKDYFRYQARQEFLRQQRTMELEREMLEQQVREKDAALQEKEGALQETRGALQEKEGALQETRGALQESRAALRATARLLIEAGLPSRRIAEATQLSEAEVDALREHGQEIQH